MDISGQEHLGAKQVKQLFPHGDFEALGDGESVDELVKAWGASQPGRYLGNDSLGGYQLARRRRQIEASARQPGCGVNLLDENIRDDQHALLGHAD